MLFEIMHCDGKPEMKTMGELLLAISRMVLWFREFWVGLI